MLVLRIGLGTVMFAHGAQKMFGWFGGPGPAGFVGFMGSMGVPAFLAWLAILVEFVGGIAVLLGPFARIAALGFAVNMIVALAMVSIPHRGFLGTSQSGGWEFEFVLLTMALAIFCAGPGRYAIAPALEMKWLRRRAIVMPESPRGPIAPTLGPGPTHGNIAPPLGTPHRPSRPQ
jgi:putative oxidoreductase